ncbi:DNA polymerase I [Candidatus Uhrbacteria bacterium]|nr:DNA polymerase I [Candidatus Uhrbacteria bacterium]
MPKAPATKHSALIIDANALIHRAWHALPPLTAPDGRLVNAVYGFASVLMKVLGSERPDYLVVCWDTPEPTYRHKAKSEYKAQREEQPEAFYAQMPMVKEVVEVLGGTNVEAPGFEADDLLATFAVRLAKNGVDVTLLTSDRDVWQCIAPHVRVLAFKKGVTETVTYDEKTLKETIGLTPEQIADYKAMRGDPSDNLKGVPGIGEKTATDLLIAYKNLDGVLKAAHDPKSKLSPSVRQKLLDGEQEARDTLPLVQLVSDVPVKQTDEDLRRRTVDEAELRKLFTSFGFKTLLARALGSTPEMGAAERADIRPKKGKPVESSATTMTDLATLIASAKKAQSVIVRPMESEQPSLFAEAPALALGTGDAAVVISSGQLKDKKVAEALSPLLADPKIEKVGHGLKSAWHWARRNGFDLNGMTFDIEIASLLLAGGEGRHDLPSLAAAHADTVLEDSTGRPLREIEVIRTLHVFFQQELAAQHLDAFLARFETPLIPILAQMEEHGILIDRLYFKMLTEDFRKEKSRLEKEMEKLAGEPFNPGSPQQLAHVLFDVLKLPTKGIKRGKTGISTAAAELEKLDGSHPIVTKITEYREVAKLLSTYVEALPALADTNGRVHTTYNQIGAATGRMSSQNPNLQNIPIRTELGRKIRRGFIAPKGYHLLSCDYSQIELRVVAALAKDKKMIEAFERGLDIHTATAAAIWGVPLDEVTKEQRRAAKAINFGIIYGQGPVGLSKAAGISFEEAKRFIDEYFHVYSGIHEYLEQTKALAHARGYVETLFGRRRAIPDINSPLPQFRAAAERMAINMPVQGTATGDLVKLALIAIDKELSKISKDARLLLQVHDELVFEVPEKEVPMVAKKIVEIMESIEKIGVPIVVDSKFGTNWDEMEKI